MESQWPTTAWSPPEDDDGAASYMVYPAALRTSEWTYRWRSEMRNRRILFPPAGKALV
jgi:hypothetical protein